MYASTATCSINVASTSNLPNQQHSAGAIPTTNPAMYYVSQLPADAYTKQIIQYGGDSTAAVQYGQENVYPSKEVYTSPTNTYNRLPAYSYNLPTGQTEFTSNVQFSAQPPPPNQNNSTATPQILPQNYHNQAPIHASPHPVNHQIPNLMFPPPKTYHQKRGPESYPPAQLNYQNNSVPASIYNNSPAAPIYQPNANPQKMQNIQHNNGNNNNNGQDQRNSRLSTMFDSTADNYTASWVSSTSSIPADQKIPPDQNSTSPTFEFSNWPNEMPKMSENNQQQQQPLQNPSSAQSGNYPQVQQSVQQMYYAQTPQQQFQTQNSSSAASIQPVPYFAPNQQQPFLQNMAYPVNYYMHPAYVQYPTQLVMPNAMQAYGQGFGQPVLPSILPQPNANNILYPPDAPLLGFQDEKFQNTWLDQNRPPWQEIEVLKEVLPIAMEHNFRQLEFNNQQNSRHHGNISHNNGHLSSVGSHQQQNGAESGRASRASGAGQTNHRQSSKFFGNKHSSGGAKFEKYAGNRRN